MSKKNKEKDIITPQLEEQTIPLSTLFGNKDLLKDGSNLNVKLNNDNHYFQHVHRLAPDTTHPFYYVINFDNKQYKEGPYKTIYEANRACAKKLYELYNIDDGHIVIKCECKSD